MTQAEYDNARLVTVAVPTKNRPDSLLRCVNAIRGQRYPRTEIIVIDDGSVIPLPHPGSDVRLIRNDASRGLCAVRNQVCSEAAGDLIVFFDDDAEPADPTLIARSARRFDELPLLGAVAFRQTSADGRPHRIQPDSSSEPCFVPNFYGYGFMVDGAAVASVGGFEEILGYYFDEDEFCLRLMDAGCQVIYDPSLSVIHHDDRSRDWTSIKRLMLRNRTLTTLLHYPLWATAPAIARDWVQQVAKMHSAGGIDWVGLRETTYEIVRLMPYVMRKRAPVRFSTLLRARNLRRASKPLEIALSTVTS